VFSCLPVSISLFLPPTLGSRYKTFRGRRVRLLKDAIRDLLTSESLEDMQGPLSAGGVSPSNRSSGGGGSYEGGSPLFRPGANGAAAEGKARIEAAVSAWADDDTGQLSQLFPDPQARGAIVEQLVAGIRRFQRNPYRSPLSSPSSPLRRNSSVA
jgi:hypothetical protein